MGVFDPNYKRLGLIIFCFLFLTVMYTCELVLLKNATPVLDTTYDPVTSFGFDSENDSVLHGESVNQGGDLFGMISFITYTSPEIPAWQQVFFAPVVTITLFVLLYLIIDITYDIIKALPFT